MQPDEALPTHPLTGLVAVGWRKARPHYGESSPQPIWPIAGGAPEDDETDDEADDEAGEGASGEDEDDSGGQGDDQLRPAGTKALEAEKTRRKAEAERRRTAEARIAELEQQLAAGAQSDDGPTPEQIRREATSAATAKANERIIRSEVRAAAAGKLSDPRDALQFIDLTRFEVDEDGQVDEEEVAEAIDDLIKNKPYLAAATAKPRFEGTGDGGARKGSAGTKQYTEADIKKMTPEQIDEAHRKGQLRDYMGT
jgi:hypothetical protein